MTPPQRRENPWLGAPTYVMRREPVEARKICCCQFNLTVPLFYVARRPRLAYHLRHTLSKPVTPGFARQEATMRLSTITVYPIMSLSLLRMDGFFQEMAHYTIHGTLPSHAPGEAKRSMLDSGGRRLLWKGSFCGERQTPHGIHSCRR